MKNVKKTSVFSKFGKNLIGLCLLLFGALVACGGCGGGGDGAQVTEASRWRPRSGTFVWDASLLLDPATREEELDRMQRKKVDRLLVSFTGAQIKKFRASSEDFKALSDSAKRRGMEFDLLLGDSAWILPDHRSELLDLVRFFDGYPFDKLHLDLEPDKLISRGYVREVLLRELAETLLAAKAASAHPLAVSTHWRYVSGGDLDRAREFAALADEIVVMIYSTEISEVAGRFQEICDKAAALPVKFSLAQSVENIADMIRGRESYFDYGLEDFRLAMEVMISEVAVAPNMGDLIVQGWEDFRKMK